MTLSRVAELFEEANLQWKFKDGYRVPTVDDIDDAIIRAMKAIADEPDLTQMEFGRLIVQKNGGHFDVYVHVHEIPVSD